MMSLNLSPPRTPKPSQTNIKWASRQQECNSKFTSQYSSRTRISNFLNERRNCSEMLIGARGGPHKFLPSRRDDESGLATSAAPYQ